MSLLEILLIALGVSVDAFAVSVGGAMGCSRSSWRNGLNAGIFFGGFQFLMPVAGFFAASALTGFVEKYDHWCAFGLLLFVGAKMVWDGIHDGEKKEGETAEVCQLDFFSPKKLFLPAIATSLDALAVGGSIAFSGNSLWLPAAAMGIVTGIISFLGVELGYKLKSFGCKKTMTVIGGVVIILIGFRILAGHLF
ncbi:MAG: manganese efflux pump [Lentisphaeria bacterium]|nr:manganese efflux pump [Lentisphaeria bacterium]